jgi:hypothetical protein
MKIAVKITILAVILFILDLGLTAYFLNRYEHLVSEGNIFFEYGNGMWALVLNFFHLVAIFLTAYSYGKYKTLQISSTNGFDYAKKLYLHESVTFIYIIGCYAFIVASFVSRIAVIIDWILFGIYTFEFYNTTYSIIKSLMPMGRYDVVFAFVSVFVAIPLWFRLEYIKSKRSFISEAEVMLKPSKDELIS